MESGTSSKNQEGTIWITLLISNFLLKHRGVIYLIVCTFYEKSIGGIKFTQIDNIGS